MLGFIRRLLNIDPVWYSVEKNTPSQSYTLRQFEHRQDAIDFAMETWKSSPVPTIGYSVYSEYASAKRRLEFEYGPEENAKDIAKENKELEERFGESEATRLHTEGLTTY